MVALRKLTWVELKLFAREPFALVFTFAFPLVVMVVLNGSFQPGDPAFGDAAPSSYYLASYIGVVIGAIGLIVLPAHVAGYREQGVMRRFRAAGVPAWASLGAQLSVGALVAAVGSVVLVGVGALAFGAALPVLPAGAVAAFVLGTVSFLALGLALAIVLPTARAAQAVGMLLFFPMWLLSGAGPPPKVMGATMRQVSDVLPLTWVVHAVQEPWLGTGTDVAAMTLLAALLLGAAGLSLRSLRTA